MHSHLSILELEEVLAVVLGPDGGVDEVEVDVVEVEQLEALAQFELNVLLLEGPHGQLRHHEQLLALDAAWKKRANFSV